MSERTLAVKVNLTAFNRLTAPFEAAQRSTAALSGGLRTTQHHLKDLTQQARAFDTLTAKTDKQTASYEQAKQRVKSLTAAYPALRHQTDTQKKALADARKARQNAGRELDRQKKKLNAVRGALYRHGISARKGADVTGQLTRRTEAYNRTLSTQKQRLEAVTRAQRRYSDAKKTRDRLMSGGAKATAAGAGLLYETGKLIAPGRGFGAQMSKVQALLDLNKEDAALAGLRAQARQMGASTRYTATDAATAQSVLAAAGLTPEAIRASLKAVLNLADAGGIGLEESAGLGATVANQFELPASQMGRISDTLVKTAKSADTNLTILAESFRKAGSAAHMAGLSVEETGVLFDSMADAGIKGAPAGTAVSQMLNSLITPSEKGKKALDQLGISVRDQTGRMKDFRVIAGELGQAMQGFDRAGQMQILTELFGGSAIVKSGSLAVIKALHSGKFDRLLADNLKAAGVAAKDAAVMADNLDGDLLTLRSAWEDLGIELSDNVDPPPAPGDTDPDRCGQRGEKLDEIASAADAGPDAERAGRGYPGGRVRHAGHGRRIGTGAVCGAAVVRVTAGYQGVRCAAAAAEMVITGAVAACRGTESPAGAAETVGTAAEPGEKIRRRSDEQPERGRKPSGQGRPHCRAGAGCCFSASAEIPGPSGQRHYSAGEPGIRRAAPRRRYGVPGVADGISGAVYPGRTADCRSGDRGGADL